MVDVGNGDCAIAALSAFAVASAPHIPIQARSSR
jgi:hypothetical protein